MMRTATLKLKFEEKRQLDAIFRALEPETRVKLASRSKVEIKRQDDYLVLVFEAKDTSALRAAVNSYLRWIRLMKDALDAVKDS
jgi:tRNA threonylcarbamoyladenosine modification (KEOPS) complex  Pcc1 subunit